MKKTLFILCLSALSLTRALADEPTTQGLDTVELKNTHDPKHSENKWDCHRVDSHAPIGVMGDHTHNRGDWMFSYRFMSMSMEQNYDGTDTIGSNSFISAPGGGQPFLIAPTRMSTEMHMFGAMYGVTDALTAMIMLPYLSKEMSHVRFDGVTFDTESEGIGDLKLLGLYKVYDEHHQRIHLHFGLSLPTGSITESDATPNAPPPLGNTVTRERRLPYSMQLGSGSVDLLPGVTYLGQHENVSWGTQVKGVLRTHENDEDYMLGHEFEGTGWIAYRWLEWLSTSMRIDGKVWGDISGRDPAMLVPTPMGNTRAASTVVPTADPERRSGERIDLSWGLNIALKEGFLKGNRIAVEAGMPIYQHLDGPQLGGDWFVTAGWQWAF